MFQAFSIASANSLSHSVSGLLSANIISNHITIAQALFKFSIIGIYSLLEKGNQSFS
ncbi:MAG: hypothetical protein LBF15_02470 [Candidatus Peribacteria bacterium]|jgi:hypothetical protein|nr:hypothetical protein [Candidatus Peribacteria bacterium]